MARPVLSHSAKFTVPVGVPAAADRPCTVAVTCTRFPGNKVGLTRTHRPRVAPGNGLDATGRRRIRRRDPVPAAAVPRNRCRWEPEVTDERRVAQRIGGRADPAPIELPVRRLVHVVPVDPLRHGVDEGRVIAAPELLIDVRAIEVSRARRRQTPFRQRNGLSLGGGELGEPAQPVRLREKRTELFLLARRPVAVGRAVVAPRLVVEVEADEVDVRVPGVVVGKIVRAAGIRIPFEREVLTRHGTHGVDDLPPVADERGRLTDGRPREPPGVELPAETDDRIRLAARHHVPGQFPEVGVVCPCRPLLQAVPAGRGRTRGGSVRKYRNTPDHGEARALPSRHVGRRRPQEGGPGIPVQEVHGEARPLTDGPAKRADTTWGLVADVDPQGVHADGRCSSSRRRRRADDCQRHGQRH